MEAIITHISKGTTIIGDLDVKGGVKIEGRVQGSVNITGDLILVETGYISGKVTANSAIIAGKIDGPIKVFNKITLAPKSVIKGDIETRQLIIEEGAFLNGNCVMNEVKSKNS